MNKKHFFLGNNIAEIRDFTPHNQYGSKELPQRDRKEHGTFVKDHYVQVVNQAMSCLEERGKKGFPVADGFYVGLEIDKNFVPPTLGKRPGVSAATIMKVSDKGDDTNIDMTVYIKKNKRDWLSDKADKYANEDTKKGNPKHADLIASINNVTQTGIHQLYVSAEKFDLIPTEGAYEYELWLCRTTDQTDEKVHSVLAQLDIVEVTSPLKFEAVEVWLIQATKEQLRLLPFSLGYIEEIRPYHKPSILLASISDSRDWSTLIRSQIVYDDDASKVQVDILDSGVNNEHELLKPALPDERMDTAIGVSETTDKIGHGTGMAGLVLLGDLTDIVYKRESIVHVHHGLSSIKIIDKDYATEKEFYGAVIEEAINKASDMNCSIQCMAVTDDDSYEGTATSSSAALDESIYHNGLCDRLVIVSAGNVCTQDVDDSHYLESCKSNAIKSPAQAWNALSVGAFTENAVCEDPDFRPLAALGGISPFSCSSFSWPRKRNKPEIVMEGGNLAYHQSYKITPHEDLELVTTCMDLKNSLESFYATSAATALAARLAAKIKIENPQLSTLSIRGLMVHSAQWTDEMKRIENLEERMSLCGYGVPNEDLAIHSNEKYATYIFENTLVPYVKKNNSNKYNEPHFYDLPWPKEVLSEMGDEKVCIRITLSYYVKPSPGYAGRTSRYRYPSATLHFDLKTATETQEEFLSRHNKNEGASTTSNDSSRWIVKQQKRERGTVQSDWIDCMASQLADLDQIVVFPGQGWWKERKLENIENAVPYSLIISIKTTETKIYSAVETAIKNRIGVQIVQEV